MSNKSKHIFFYLAKMPVVLLYLCFFTVQLLSFNSDSSNSVQSTSWYNNARVIKSKISASAGKADTNKSNSNIRLNKRFQPEKAICYTNNFVVKTPAFRLIEKLHRVYTSEFIPLSFFATHLLRGPPSVA